LKLNPSKIIEKWRREFSQNSGAEIPNILGIKNKAQSIFDIKIYLIGFFVLLIFLYIGFSIKRVLFTSDLEILNPPQDLLTTESSLIITGLVDLGADVFINDQPIEQVNEGKFEQEIKLLPGLNSIKISD